MSFQTHHVKQAVPFTDGAGGLEEAKEQRQDRSEEALPSGFEPRPVPLLLQQLALPSDSADGI